MTTGDAFTLRELFDERDKRYEQRFISIENTQIKSDIALGNAVANADKNVAVALQAIDKATSKTELAVEKRFDSVNEFRAALTDQQVTFARKSEVDFRFDSLEKKMDAAIEQLQRTKGRDDGSAATWGIFVVVATLVLSTAGIITTVFLVSK